MRGDIIMKCEQLSALENISIPLIAMRPDLVPVYASKLAAGADVRAAIEQEITILPGESQKIPTGLRMSIPEGYEIQVRPRSGLALNHQLTVLNSPGTIDADYRGEISVIMINHGKKAFVVEPGMKIAQLVCAAVCQATFITVEHLSATERGQGGFGHTGL